MDKQHEEMFRQTSMNLADTVKLNKDRLDAARAAFNRSNATVFVCIGLQFDHRAGVGIPVIVGSQWVTSEQAIHLLEQAIVALQPNILDDQGRGGQS